MNTEKIEISIIIPITNEKDNIEPLADEVSRTMKQQPWSWECLWIDDGSNDGSLEILRKIHEADAHHQYLSFKENKGQSAGLYAGFQEARGIVFATIDGDGQNDPADLPKLIQMVMSGEADMVNGYRRNRRDNLTRRISSKIANRFRNWTTGKSVQDVGCSTRAFRRECVAYLPKFRGMHRFMPTLIAMGNFRLLETPVNHRIRRSGKSKYNISNRLWVGLYDVFGIMWLKKRAFQFTIKNKSR